MSFEMTITIENAEEVNEAINKFGRELEFGLFDGMTRLAAKEEPILKSTTGFSDVTGHLRRSLFVTAVLHPLGIEIGALAEYSYWVEFGHGSWIGGWFREYIADAYPRIVDGIGRVLKKLVDEFNQGGIK